jgi:hypothetical protein
LHHSPPHCPLSHRERLLIAIAIGSAISRRDRRQKIAVAKLKIASRARDGESQND